MGQNSVIFKGKKDGIRIILDNKITFNELKDVFKEKILQSGSFFQGASLSVSFSGRDLKDDEEMELLNIISENSGFNISFVYDKDEKTFFAKQQKLSKIDDNINLNKRKNSAENINMKLPFSAFENVASFHKGSVRSGQSVKFKGSIIIIGDINPGGEVIAEGNIIVLGAARGLLHAGCRGHFDCFVIAFDLRPTQLRIADIVTYFPEKSKKGKGVPECAFEKEGEIYVESLIHF